MNEPSVSPGYSNPAVKLSVVEKVGFGVGDLASGLLYSTFGMFLLFFYTDVVGLSASSIFVIFLITKGLNIINDPLMGMIADRTVTRWGKYRPYILWLAVPFGISAYLLFTVPELSPSGKVLYCAGTYILAMVMYTGINIPYCALMGVLTSDHRERTSVSQYRFFLAFFGGWLINTFTLPLARYFGRDVNSAHYLPKIGYDPVAGYSSTMLVFGVLAAVLFFMTFFTTRERVVPLATRPTSVRNDLKDLVRNVPWLVLLCATALNLTHLAIRNGVMLYYLSHYLADANVGLFTINFGFFNLEVTRTVLFMSSGSLVSIIGVLCTQTLLRGLGKRNALMFVIVATGLLESAGYFAGPDDYNLLLGLSLAANFISGAGATILFAMFADVVDYSEWKTSRRATGLIMATFLFGIKGGLLIGGQLLTGALAMIGYSTETAHQPEVQEWVRWLFTWIPGLMAAGAGLLLLKYPLNDQLMSKIESDLAARKSAA